MSEFEKLKLELNNKNVLLVGPVYFGYEKEIIGLMETAGARVDFLQENVDVKSVANGLVNKLPAGICTAVRNVQMKSAMSALKNNKYDIIFGLRMDFFNDKLMEIMKNYWPDAKYCLYFWDSCKNMRRPKEVARHFSRVSSFDRFDCKEMASENWQFRPLFYLPKYAGASTRTDKDIDVLYVASLFPNRAKSYLKLKEYCCENNLTLKTLLYVKKAIFEVQKKGNPDYAAVDETDLRFESISAEEIIELMGRSKVMFDCSHARQSGLTMRTVECVGACQKLASTNEDLKEYDFFDESNILILSEDNFDGLKEFVQGAAYQQIPEDVYNKYSLSHWLMDILGC